MLPVKSVFANPEGEEKLAASRGRRDDVRSVGQILRELDQAMWEWFNETDLDDIKLLVSAITCLVGSLAALLAYYFYR
jgi:hypothetical protein